MTRQVLAGPAIALAAVVLTLLALEAAVRLGTLERRQYRSTRIETVHRAPMSAPDLRHPKSRVPAKRDAFRILVIGDSFAWGDGVHPEDAFPWRLETRLNQKGGARAFEVVNWSHPGWGTRHQQRSVVRKLDYLAPDLVILSFVLNDPESPVREERPEGWGPTLRREPVNDLSRLLHRRSRLYRLLWTRLEIIRQRRALGRYYRGLFEGESWEKCQRALRRLEAEVSGRSIEMVMVLFPLFESDIDDEYRFSELHALVRGAAAASGIPILDLLETYRGVEGRRLSLVPFTDAHPSELAHRMAADAILEFLVEERVVELGHRRREPADTGG